MKLMNDKTLETQTKIIHHRPRRCPLKPAHLDAWLRSLMPTRRVTDAGEVWRIGPMQPFTAWPSVAHHKSGLRLILRRPPRKSCADNRVDIADTKPADDLALAGRSQL